MSLKSLYSKHWKHRWKASESNLMKHAQRELDLFLGPDDSEDFYQGMTRKAVMELVEAFARQGHSGMSAGIVLDLFRRLANFDALTPLTDNPDEWIKHADDMWQNARQSSSFSSDHGKTYWDLGTSRDTILHTEQVSK